MKQSILIFQALLVFVYSQAQTDARLFRYPDVSSTHIAFVYGGDVWMVPKTGGTAMRVTSSTGEESFPRFSPDGKMLAFTATYKGNADAYVMPVDGGMPARLTWHAMGDRVVDWHPDGKRVLIASARETGVGNVSQFYLVNKAGGMAEKLPIPYGELGSISSDGNNMVYVSRITENYPFKRYRGGLTSDLVLFDLKNLKAKNLTNSTATDAKPVFVKNKIYYLSDNNRERRLNLWMYDPATSTSKQLTQFTDFDINHMSGGEEELVFEAAGQLHLYNVNTNKHQPVNIKVLSDYSTLMPRVENVGQNIISADISPDGKRAVVEARGELFSVPAEYGPVLNLTNSSGAFDQFAAWSPNGKYIAWWSDKSGEYELWLQEANGSNAKKLTSYNKGMGFKLHWSNDSKKIAFINHEQEIHVVNVSDGNDVIADKTTRNVYGALRGFHLAWSPDNRWLAYNKTHENENEGIFLYDTQDKKVVAVTSGYYNDVDPVFDSQGKYLFFKTDRSLQPVYGGSDGTWIYPNSTQLAYLTLDPSAKSLLAPRNDEVKISITDTATAVKPAATATKPETDKPKPAATSKAIVVNTNNMEARTMVFPVQAGNYGSVVAADGKLIYQRFPNSGSAGEQPSLFYYDLEKREEKRITQGIRGFSVSADGKNILVLQGNNLGLIKPMPEQRMEKPLRTGEMEMMLNPKEEWTQIFNDTWRRYRDFFYDPGMQQVDWNGAKKYYSSLLDHAITRWDVAAIQQEMLAENSAGHTYVQVGDAERASNRGSGFLGANFELADGGYRIKKIITPAAWDNEVRSPLELAGNIAEGDYIVAVNGRSVDANLDPSAALDGLIGTTVLLRVNKQPGLAGSREVLVNTLTTAQERRLRHLAWIESNRKKVEELSGGKLGYMYMPNTAQLGQTELMRQFYAQINKEGFIIDERFNGGGQLGDRFIEMLNRKNLYNIAWRNAGISRVPLKGNDGPKVMLINGWAGSGGDAFPWAFKTMNMGPIIGERTTGILVGPATGHQLIDGGSITVPDARLYGPDGKWFWEGVGVTPTIEVWDDPAELAKGNDPQLIRGVEEAMKLVKQNPRKLAPKPAFEDRTYKGLEKQ